MKKIFEIAAGILAIGGVSYPILNINIFIFRIFAFLFLLILVITYMFNATFIKWEKEIKDTAKSGMKYLLILSRSISFFFIVLLIGIPYVYETIPSWATNETIYLMNTIKKDGKNYDLKIIFDGKSPDIKEELFIYLRDTSKTRLELQECGIGCEAQPVVAKLIGTPKNWLPPFVYIFLGISIILLLVMYPYKVLATK